VVVLREGLGILNRPVVDADSPDPKLIAGIYRSTRHSSSSDNQRRRAVSDRVGWGEVLLYAVPNADVVRVVPFAYSDFGAARFVLALDHDGIHGIDIPCVRADLVEEW
jgi:hypothetical protein